MENKISEESAEKELQRLFDYYEIDKEEFTSLEKDAQKAIENFKKRIKKGIMRGSIIFDDSETFEIIQKTKDGKEIRYQEMGGNAKVEMDKHPEQEASMKCYALLGSLSGLGPAAIRNLKGPDLRRAEAIGSLLLFC